MQSERGEGRDPKKKKTREPLPKNLKIKKHLRR